MKAFTSILMAVLFLGGCDNIASSTRNDLIETIEKLKSENQQLEEEIERLKTDPQEIEKVAREELGMVKPDEHKLIIQPKKKL